MRTGRCQCGAVRFESTGGVVETYVCHCRECQKQSSSAFGVSVEVPRAGLRVTQGQPKFWDRGTDTGKQIRCAFCLDCGSRLWHESTGPSETVTIKGGALEVALDLSGAIHIGTKRKLAGIAIPDGARQFPGEPD